MALNVCLQDRVYKSTDVAVLLDEIRSCQDVLSRITDTKLGYLGTALVTIINQVWRLKPGFHSNAIACVACVA